MITMNRKTKAGDYHKYVLTIVESMSSRRSVTINISSIFNTFMFYNKICTCLTIPSSLIDTQELVSYMIDCVIDERERKKTVICIYLNVQHMISCF
jgi:hypothetical protein